MAFSLLLLGKFSSKNPNFHYKISSFIRKTQSFFKPNDPKHFSSTSQPDPNLSDPKTTLSARMSFVFDQIDAIEKERNNKDEALQRIRAWRETKKKKTEDEEVKEGSKFEGSEKNLGSEMERKRENLVKKEMELVHPWKEWIELMERLVQQNYFDHRRNEEEKLLEGLSIDVAAAGLPEERVDFDFTKDWMSVKTACLNFGRDRFDILRSLSRQDIQVLVGHGCPSVDKKVVFSAKLLRKHVHLDEGDVCSSCNMRSSCDRAYLVTLKEDEARTLDIMRVLLTYGFDPMNGSVENKSLLKMKSVKTVVRKLLHEVVKLSAVPIDPNLPPPVFKKPPLKVKQPPPPPKRRVGRDDVEMKKGDWLCPKCDFMNFAKNTVCLQCDAKRPKRQLLPGEWECPECNFLNYRRNMACFHCDHKRPNDEFMENQMHIREDGPRERGPRTRLEKVASTMPEVSNAWNFDFDDNESDGADVAAFEYADPPKVSDNSFGENNSQEGNFRGFEHDDSLEKGRTSMNRGGGKYSDLSQRKSGTGFDDFDDEEEDDVDSYELETSDNNSMQRASTRNFSDVEEYSESEDFDAADLDSVTRRGTNKSSRNNSPRSTREAFSGSEDDGKDLNSDEGLSVYSNWKSSRIGEPRSKVRGQGRNSPYRGMNFDSDNKLETDSGSDDDGEMHHGRGSKQKGRDSWSSNRRDFQRGQCSDSEDGLAFGSESDDDNLPFSRNKTRGNKAGPGRGGNTFRGHSQFESTRGGAFRHNGRTNDKRNSSDNADWGRSIRGSHTGQRGPREDGYGEDRMNSRRGSSGRGRQDGFRHNNRMNERRENSFGDSDRGKSYQGSRTNGREFARDDYGRGRMNGRRGNARDFRGAGRDERFGYQQRERSNGFKDNRDGDFGDDRPRRRIIER